ncbi:MAG TPA: hypothetical protein VGK73_40590 [Polyangiaceae bacterium]
MATATDVRARIDTFVEDLTILIRAATVDAVADALEAQSRVTAHSGGSSRYRGARAKGAKRDPEVLAALTEQLASHIGENPGQRIEEIGKALGIATRELVLPVRKLVAAKRVSTQGQKRSTTYHLAAARPTKKASADAKPARAKAERAKPARAKPARAKSTRQLKLSFEASSNGMTENTEIPLEHESDPETASAE